MTTSAARTAPMSADSAGAVTTARASRPLAALSLLVIAVLVVASAIVLFVPGVYFILVAPELDELLNSAAVVIAGLVALLAWARYRETGGLDALFQASAFITLFLGAGLPIVLFVGGSDLYASYLRETPGQAPMYAWSAQRLAAGGLLVIGAIAALRGMGRPSPARATVIAVAPALAVLTLAVAALAFEPSLPVLVEPDVLRQLLGPVSSIEPDNVSLQLMVLQLGIAVVYLVGAAAYARLWARTENRAYTALLSMALIVGAFSQLHYAIVPGSYSELVTSADILRVLFYLVVVVGVAAATRGDLRALRVANRSLDELRHAEAVRATAEERARFAREIHDGLVQELWLARLTGGRLAELPNLPPEATEVIGRLDAVLESALGEARQAVVTLQPDPDVSFAALLRRFVDDYADRFGMEVDVVIEGDVTALPTQYESDLLRICREALNNVRKHADATTVTVRLEGRAGGVRLTVADDGAGYDVERVGAGGYGLESLRQRTTHIGGRLEIRSAPGAGTKVTVDVDA